MASQTKLVTTIAAMQTVEQGLIGLDDDVFEWLPELSSLKILDGTKDKHAIPQVRPRTNKITLRWVAICCKLQQSDGLQVASISSKRGGL